VSTTSERTFRVRHPRVAMALVVAITLALGWVGAPARAANLDGVCNSGEICIYVNADFGRSLRDMNHDDNNYQGNYYKSGNFFGEINDTVSSMKNTTSSGAWFFVNKDGGGNKLHVAANGSRRNLKLDAFPDGGNWNDRISSHCIIDSSRPSWCG
jgi:Peptidase inhibitor family I36